MRKGRMRKATQDAPVIERMKALAAQYRRFGYRRIGIFSQGELTRCGRHLGPPAPRPLHPHAHIG
jgi:hypothetical protein